MLEILSVWKTLVEQKLHQTLESLRFIGTKIAKQIVKTEEEYSNELQDMMLYGEEFKNWVNLLDQKPKFKQRSHTQDFQDE